MLEVGLYIHDDSIEYTFPGSDFLLYSESNLDRWRQIILSNESYYEGVILIKLDGISIFGFDCFDAFNDMISYYQTACRLIINGSSHEYFYLPSQPYKVEFRVAEGGLLELNLNSEKCYNVPKLEFLCKVLEACILFHSMEYNVTQSEFAIRDLEQAEELIRKLNS